MKYITQFIDESPSSTKYKQTISFEAVENFKLIWKSDTISRHTAKINQQLL